MKKLNRQEIKRNLFISRDQLRIETILCDALISDARMFSSRKYQMDGSSLAAETTEYNKSVRDFDVANALDRMKKIDAGRLTKYGRIRISGRNHPQQSLRILKSTKEYFYRIETTMEQKAFYYSQRMGKIFLQLLKSTKN